MLALDPNQPGGGGGGVKAWVLPGLQGHHRPVARPVPAVRRPECAPIETAEIPYQGTTLPGYFLRPDAGGQRRPTIVIGDNASEELYYWVGPPALERGYNALLVDLPGIGLNSFNGIPFRADTEVPVTAVIDYLCARGDVDPRRIAAYGGGEGGGYIMARAAAHEPSPPALPTRSSPTWNQ